LSTATEAVRNGAPWREVAPALARFARAAPDVVLDLTVTDAINDFVADGSDAALRPGEVVDQDMVSIRIGPDLRQIAVASPAYLEKQCWSTGPKRFLASTFATPSNIRCFPLCAR